MDPYETDFPELNPDDPSKDAWSTPKRDLQGDRPPGLIDLQRYPISTQAGGIATFLQRPIALTPADLKAAEVDVAMVGAGLDFSTGMRGAKSRQRWRRPLRRHRNSSMACRARRDPGDG